MTTNTLRMTLPAMMVLALAPAGLPAADDGFVRIFDGKTLDGWQVVPEETARAWSVANGVIQGASDADVNKSYLVYDRRELADFELKLMYRFPDGRRANSGVSIRAVPDPTGRRRFQCYHADFGHAGIGKHILGAWDFHTPGRKEHRCFRGDRLVIDKNDKPTITPIDGGLTSDDINRGDWNRVHVIARGNHFRFFINGKLSSEFTEHLPPQKRLREGMIQLQIHDPNMTVQFKALRLKRLPAG